MALHSSSHLFISPCSIGVRHFLIQGSFLNRDSFLNQQWFQYGGRGISYVKVLGFRGRNRGRLGSVQAVHDFGGSVQRNDAAMTGPLVKPSPKFSAEEAVREQLKALSENDNPRQDHGLEVLYYFSNTSGTFEGGSLPRYFGFASDLYHFGHFALKFKTRYPSLINFLMFEILQIGELKESPSSSSTPNSFSKTGIYNSNKDSNTSYENDGNVMNSNSPSLDVIVKVIRENGSESVWVFNLSRVQRGILDPCWLTNQLLPYQMDGNKNFSSVTE